MRKFLYLLLYRQFESPPPASTLPGLAYWIGQICLFLSVFLAFKTGSLFRSQNEQAFSTFDLPALSDEGLNRKKSPIESYASISSSSIFSKPKSAEPVPSSAPPPSANSKLKLVAINQSSSGLKMAIIEDSSKQQQDVFELKDSIFGQATLVEIQADRVSLERNGKIEVLAMSEKEPGGSDTPGGVPSSDQTDFTVPEEELSSALANLPQLLSQARAVPYFRNGQSIGMRLFAIRSGSLYEKLGLKNGDILLSVNDNSLSDPAQALKIFEQLKSERTIGVKVERNSQLTDLHYSIR